MRARLKSICGVTRMVKLRADELPARPRRRPVILDEATARSAIPRARRPKLPVSLAKESIPLEERLRAGDVCYAITDGDGEVESYVWMASPGRALYVRELGTSVRIPAETAYLYDAYTVPQARGKGRFTDAARQAARDALGSWARRCEAWTDQNNASSLRALRGAGFEPYDSCKAISAGPFGLILSGEPRMEPSERRVP